jgi:hypothetical protein
MEKSRGKTIAILTLAAIGPFSVIWGTATLVAKLNKPTPAATVEKFSDYVTGRRPVQHLAPATEIWSGVTGDDIPWFKDLALVGDHLVVLGRSKVVVIDPTGNTAPRELAIPEGAKGGSTLGNASADGTVWVYGFESGRYTELAVGNDLRVLRQHQLEPALLQPIQIGSQVYGNGLFADELWRTFELRPVAAATDWKPGTMPPPAEKVLGSGGAPLFPGINKQFARLLNETTLAAQPSGFKLALAFKWSDRINVYDTQSGNLERSIAGPIETKLSFAVDHYDGKPVMTLGPETVYNYVDLVATDDLIVGLYAGREFRKFRSTMATGTAIHAFTWDGRLIGEWELAEPLDNLALDATHQRLYALRWKPKASVVSVDVSALFAAAPRPARRAAK